MISNTTFEWSADIRVLNTISFKHMNRTIIHFNRQINFCLTLRTFDNFHIRTINPCHFCCITHHISYIFIWVITMCHNSLSFCFRNFPFPAPCRMRIGFTSNTLFLIFSKVKVFCFFKFI